MSSDDGSRLPDPRPVDFALPRVVEVEIRTTRFQAPRLRNFASSLESSEDAVEFTVRTDGPIPIRALGPALYVGERPVTEVTEIADNAYRFIAPTARDLEENAPIRLGWTGQRPSDRGGPTFTFHREALKDEERRLDDEGTPA